MKQTKNKSSVKARTPCFSILLGGDRKEDYLSREDAADLTGDALDPSPEGILEVIAADAVRVSLREHQPQDQIPTVPPARFQSRMVEGEVAIAIVTAFAIADVAVVDHEDVPRRIGHEPPPPAPPHLPDGGTDSIAPGQGRVGEERKEEEENRSSSRHPVPLPIPKEEEREGPRGRRRRGAPPAIGIKGVPPPPPTPPIFTVVVGVPVIISVIAYATAVFLERRRC